MSYLLYDVATAPTACGIESCQYYPIRVVIDFVATAPTACGIERELIELLKE